jgi:twitching motility protein PilT
VDTTGNPAPDAGVPGGLDKDFGFFAPPAPDTEPAPVQTVREVPAPAFLVEPEPSIDTTDVPFFGEGVSIAANEAADALPKPEELLDPAAVAEANRLADAEAAAAKQGDVAPAALAPVASLAPAAAPSLAPVAEPAGAPVAPSLSPEMLRQMEAEQAAGPAPVAVEAPVGIADAEHGEHSSGRGQTEDAVQDDDIVLQDLLMEMVEAGASDLHLTSGTRPMIRLNGSLVPLEDQPELTPPVIQRVLYAAITQQQREKFEEKLELDFAYSVPGRARFRVNVYRQRDALGAAFRLIPYEIKPLEALGVPPSVANFAMLPRGFVLVTGPTGSGKSTTLAAIVDLANRNRREHILTVEDPIEFLHRHQGCVVNQREVGEDTHSFANALKHALRQDPDIILVGEMRDLETISVALTAAETGHLVFGTLHTSDAAQTIDRVIDVFPPHQQQQVRVQLAGSLQGIVCQTLCKTADGKGRAVATEVLVATPAIRNLIREGKTHQIYSAMQAGAQFGMHTMDQHLADLVNRRVITYEVGLEKCHHVEDFNRLTGR